MMEGTRPRLFPRAGSAFRPLALFALSRLWFGMLMVYFAPFFTRDQTGRPLPVELDYWTTALTWDGDWYLAIADLGYPSKLEIGPDGIAEKSEWAFYPLWPMMCRAVEKLTSAPFWFVGPTLALLLGACASYVLYLLCHRVGLSETRTMLLLSTLFFSPLGVFFSLAYTESLALLLLASTLLMAAHRRYLWACGPVVLLAFTRPIGLALAIAFLILFLFKLRESDASPTRERLELAALSLFSLLSFALWPGIVAVRLGSPTAYLQVQEAWRQYYTGTTIQWLITGSAENWLLALGTVLAGVSIVFSVRKRVNGEAWPHLLQAWTIGYLVFLLITVPGGNMSDGEVGLYPSTLRYLSLALLPILPLSLVLDHRLKHVVRVGLIGSLVILNIVVTLFYFRYFVVMEPPSLHYWL